VQITRCEETASLYWLGWCFLFKRKCKKTALEFFKKKHYKRRWYLISVHNNCLTGLHHALTRRVRVVDGAEFFAGDVAIADQVICNLLCCLLVLWCYEISWACNYY